ncbi:MAG: DNA polymerase III subunit delta' C-terminal domain-containing protein, partial [Longimicrobiales bacterium]
AAHAAGVSGARGGFRDALDMFALWLRDLAAAAEGAEDLVVNQDELDVFRRIAARYPGAGRGVPAAVDRVEHARGLTANNVNPQLALAWLLREVGAELRGEVAATPPTEPSGAADPKRALRMAMGGPTR